MRINQYNKNPLLRLTIFTIILLLTEGLITQAKAQQVGSITLNRNIEKFKEYRTTNRERALEYAQLIIDDLDSTTMTLDAAIVYDFMAEHSETELFRYSEALNYRLRSAAIFESLDNRPCVARTNALLGRLYLRNGDYHNAFSHSIKALGEARTLGDSTSVREAYLALEQITYFYHNDDSLAMEYNRLVASSWDSREQAHQAVRALNNRFIYTLSPDDVRDIISRSEEICHQYNFDDLLINIYLNATFQELSFEDAEASARYLAKAKPLIGNYKDEGYYYSAKGFYELSIGHSTEAIKSLSHSIELLGDGDFDSKNVHSYFLLQDIYHREGRHREAYDALMAFAETYTRQHNSGNIVELSRLINDMELEQAAEERRRLEEAHALRQKHGHMVIYFCIFCVVTLIFIGALIYSRYRLERKNRLLHKRQAEQELSHKNEIIKIQRLQQFQEQNNIDKLTEELNAAINISDGRELRLELRRIIRQLQQSAGSGGDWADVEMTLVNSNDTFFENLLKEYPNLTKNERKLCTLIHLNLSTKEIANITHQSTGSINVARSRLRQKFGLTDSDISLIAFLDRFDTPRQ